MKSRTKRLWAVGAACALGIASLVPGGRVSAASPSSFTTMLTGISLRTTSALSPFCIPGTVTYVSSSTTITGAVTAGAGAFAGYVNLLGEPILTDDVCSVENVVANGHFSGPTPISGWGVGSLTGTVSAGTFIRLGYVTIASTTLSYSIAGASGLNGSVSNMRVTAVWLATPIAPSFGAAILTGTVAGSQID